MPEESGDGRADLLWQKDTSGAVAVWLMNGTSVPEHVVPLDHAR